MTPPPQPHAKDLKAIEDYIYSSMNHTEEWRAADQAYQNILAARSRPAPSPTKEQCRKYWLYRADSGHLYHLLYDLLGEMPTEDTLGDALMKARDQVAQAREKTLTDVLKALDDVVLIDENNQYYLWLEDAECAVESLRTEAPK